jgi:hypothetical protein
MAASHAQTSAWVLLASAALFPLASAAQSGPAPASQAEREIAITGAADAPPAVVYGAPDLPLMVRFDAPLKKDGVVTVLGADVRPHPFAPNAIVITPSSFLTAQTPIPVSVPLEDGVVVLTLAFSPARRDTSVRVVRRASSALPAATKGELQEVLRLVTEGALETCADADGAAVPRRLKQGNESPIDALVCGGGAFAYMSVMVRPGCAPAEARLTRGEESADVLLFRQATQPCGERTCWLVVARAPDGDGQGFALELLASDGVPCHRAAVSLKPSSP